MASTLYEPDSAIGAALDSLNLLEQSTDQVAILGASLNQDVDETGELFDVVDIYWSIPERPGTFTTRVPFLRNWLAVAFAYIGVKQAYVRAIYDGLASKADIPGGVVGPPGPVPGTNAFA